MDNSRRDFLKHAALSTAAIALAPHLLGAEKLNHYSYGVPLELTDQSNALRYKLSHRLGLGGVALGTGFAPVTAKQSDEVMQGAWDAGVRYFDTSPWYGLGLSERRMGHFLSGQNRDSYIISTKVGRLLTPSKTIPKVMWKAPSPFSYHYDYSAEGTRRSIEDSLERLGISHLDIVFIHDLSKDNDDLGDKWLEAFDVAAKGAMSELTKMRDEGLIKAWGLGVNTIEPCLKTLEVAQPDVFLSACQYSIVYHEDAVNRLLPKCKERDVSIIVGAPLNAGFLAGKDRYNYKGEMPVELVNKRTRIAKIAKEFGSDLRTVALQFCSAPEVVSSVIPGASAPSQVVENAASMKVELDSNIWKKLRDEKLISRAAPVPI